ncbi:MAG: hypothetical protein Q9187_003230 [Circinaria calcarea]
MPPFRNPFGRKPPPVNGTNPTIQDENRRPTANGVAKPGLRPDDGVSRSSSALSIKPNKEEPNEFKLSGMHPNSRSTMPRPSPPEKKSFWQRTPTSTTTSSHRSMLSENEPFSISRESFDSYRRSFDISARSPVYQPDDKASRQSLDSRSSRVGTPRSAINGTGRFERPNTTDEEGFEEVGLNDESKPKKRGLFSRFGDSIDPPSAADDSTRPTSSHRGFHIPGRKRGQSGVGAELGNIDRPATKPGEDATVR